jgi:restriction system protein
LGDGGVDIELKRPGELVLVQCKQWRAYTVGVKVARELLGVVVSRGATRGILVASGCFTAEAKRFAEQNRQIELLGDPELASFIESVRAAAGPVVPEPATTPPTRADSPACPAVSRDDGDEDCPSWRQCWFELLGLFEVPGVPRKACGCWRELTGKAWATGPARKYRPS